jgi:hypothetical protein
MEQITIEMFGSALIMISLGLLSVILFFKFLFWLVRFSGEVTTLLWYSTGVSSSTRSASTLLELKEQNKILRKQLKHMEKDW